MVLPGGTSERAPGKLAKVHRRSGAKRSGGARPPIAVFKARAGPAGEHHHPARRSSLPSPPLSSPQIEIDPFRNSVFPICALTNTGTPARANRRASANTPSISSARSSRNPRPPYPSATV